MEITKIDNLNQLEKIVAEESQDILFDEELTAKVIQIIKRVKEEGDTAVLEYTEQFDQVKLTPENIFVSQEEIEEAYEQIDDELLESLRLALERITSYHINQEEKPWRYTLEDGTVLGHEVRPIDKVGLYVPGGRANYPSTVLMGAIPARLAGCQDIMICVPPDKNGKVSPAVLVAANEVDVDSIARIGGAQAIAALAFGTESIPKRNIIAGPGNIYVTIAKKLVYGQVGLDMLAGPSEVVIIADEKANPDFIAHDLLAQAEHAPDARAYLITNEPEIAKNTIKLIDLNLEKYSLTGSIKKEEQIKIFLVSELETGIEVSNYLAPEHLELMLNKPWPVLKKIKNAGAIFIGAYSPVAAGDYLAGPNHILPTARTANFASPVGVRTFMKSSSLISLTKGGLCDIRESEKIIAEAEGLFMHGKSLEARED